MYRKRKKSKNRSSNGRTQKDVIMETKKTNSTIEMLQYQLRRYKSMRKGAECQALQIKLNKLRSQHANA